MEKKSKLGFIIGIIAFVAAVSAALTARARRKSGDARGGDHGQ